MHKLLLIAAGLVAVGVVGAEPVTLLDGKLKFDATDAFVAEKAPSSSKQSIADFKARNSDGWEGSCAGRTGCSWRV